MVRWRSLAPRCSSSSATFRLTADRCMPRARAAPAKLPARTTVTKITKERNSTPTSLGIVAGFGNNLRSADFFDVESHPTIRFRSEKVEKVGDDRYRVSGILEIRGVEKELVLDTEYLGRAKDPFGVERIAFSAGTTIDRREFGLTWNQAMETGGILVGEKVRIGLEIQAVPQAVAEAA